MTTHRLYTVDETARRLGLSGSGVRSRIQAGTLPATRERGRFLVDADAVEVAAADAERSATWWRKTTNGSRSKAARQLSRSTVHLVAVATAWREDPTNIELIEALQAAVDARNALTVRTRPGRLHP